MADRVRFLNDDSGQLLNAVRAYASEKGLREHIPAPRTHTADEWPPDYDEAIQWRALQRAKLADDEKYAASARLYYAKRPIEFINHWVTTYDPRRSLRSQPVFFPLITFPKQDELVWFVLACMRAEVGGMIEKSRDMGATWICAGISAWLWLFHPGTAVGWGSAKADKVDRLGDASSIFEKLRILIRRLPRQLLPKGFVDKDHLYYLRCINPETGSSIIGEIGDNIGRGGRTSIYFKDESAHYEHPELIEAALLSNSRCTIDISSVSGLGTLFHTKRESATEWRQGQVINDRRKTYVFIMDWSDHPEKTKEWHDTEKERLTGEGLGHVFAQEIERDYSATIIGQVIKRDWVKAAIDAHKVLGIDCSIGEHVAGLDVADGEEGGDRNALAVRRFILLHDLDEWGEIDTGRTTRRAIDRMMGQCPIEVQYDAVGVGSGVKAETNRLKIEDKMPRGMVWLPWLAGAAVQNPFYRVIDGDKESPLNKDFYRNLKAQAWWALRRRFEYTYDAVTNPEHRTRYKPDQLISISKDLPHLRTLEKELCQVVAVRDTRLKLMIDKKPDGTKSPNTADAMVMCYFPVRDARLAMTVGIAAPSMLPIAR